jgi:hypothetical protein
MYRARDNNARVHARTLRNNRKRMVTMSDMTLAEQYRNVIADLEQDIGYEEGVQETALSVLKGRLYEIENVLPDLFSEDIDKMFSWIPEVFEESTKNPDTNIAEEMNKRFSKFSQEEDDNK